MLQRLRNLVSPPSVLARGTSGVPPVVEQRAALLAGKNISYTLKRSSRRRSIGLRIDDRGLTVSVPLRASEKWLHNVLQDKAIPQGRRRLRKSPESRSVSGLNA